MRKSQFESTFWALKQLFMLNIILINVKPSCSESEDMGFFFLANLNPYFNLTSILMSAPKDILKSPKGTLTNPK